MEQFFLKLSIMLVPGLLAVTCHEVAHGFVANRFGDPTARLLGRLTLNPLRHIDPIGLLMVILIGIGWARPVPVVYGNLRHPRRDMVLVAMAGPLTNLLLACLAGVVMQSVYRVRHFVPSSLLEPLLLMAAFAVYFNLLLALFNLLPVPPLDGGRVLAGLLPPAWAYQLARVEGYGMFLVILIVVFVPGVLSLLLGPPLVFGLKLLLGPELLHYLRELPVVTRLGLFPF